MISNAPNHLAHYEFTSVPFTADELAAIERYEQGSDGTDGSDFLRDMVESVLTTESTIEEDRQYEDNPDDLTEVAEGDRAYFVAGFDWLSQWYDQLDSLHSHLRNPDTGAAFSDAGQRYLEHQTTVFMNRLNSVRSVACKWAFGTAGPQPDMDAGHVTFSDIPGISVDGRIAAESDC